VSANAPRTPLGQAAILKRICDQAIARFTGKPPTSANARRIEIAIHAAVQRHAELAPFHDLAPAVIFTDGGKPSVYFFQLPAPANAA
jgi:hypothetical protein